MSDHAILPLPRDPLELPFDCKLQWLDDIDHGDIITANTFEWLYTQPETNCVVSDGEATVTVDKARKGYRAKKKNELAELRNATITLSDRLTLIKKRNATRKKQLSNAVARTGWRGVAFRQLQRRIQSEALNRELRFHLQKYESSSHQLLQTWQKQVKKVLTEPPRRLFPALLNKPQMTFNKQDLNVAKVLMDGVEASYSHDKGTIDWDLSTTLNEPYKKSQSWRWDCECDREYSYHQEEWSLPFGIGPIAAGIPNALATVLSKECIPDVIHVPLRQGQIDAVKFMYSLAESEEEPAQYLCIRALYTSIQGQRAVFHWRAMSTLLDNPSIQFEEHGWGMGLGAQAAMVADGLAILKTVFRTCTRYYMVSSSVMRSSAERNKHFENFVNQMSHEGGVASESWKNAFETAALNSRTAFPPV